MLPGGGECTVEGALCSLEGVNAQWRGALFSLEGVSAQWRGRCAPWRG